MEVKQNQAFFNGTWFKSDTISSFFIKKYENISMTFRFAFSHFYEPKQWN